MFFGKHWAKKPIGIKGQKSQNPIEVPVVLDTTERFAHHPPWHWYL